MSKSERDGARAVDDRVRNHRVEVRAAVGQLPAQLAVDLLERLLGQQPAGDAGLVRDHDQPIPGLAQRLGGAVQSALGRNRHRLEREEAALPIARRAHELMVNEVKGGCNPAPLERRVEDGKVVIPVKSIEAGSGYFNFSKGARS